MTQTILCGTVADLRIPRVQPLVDGELVEDDEDVFVDAMNHETVILHFYALLTILDADLVSVVLF